ncbi:SCL-interrupting locus protein homolog [Diretmus argenteus]
MSCRVNLQGLTSRVVGNVFTPENVRVRTVGTSLTFPQSKAALWDSRPDGDVFSLRFGYGRNPRLLLLEKPLRLAHRQARQSNRPGISCFFLGSLTVDADEDGVTVTLDRFDPGRDQPGVSGKVPSAMVPGDVVVPCVFFTQRETHSDVVVQSAADLHESFKMLWCCFSSREPMELAKLLNIKGHISCSQQADRVGFCLSWSAVTSAISLDMVAIRSIPIIPTALVRNLTGLSSLAQPLHNANRQRGFLTMDQTRKLILLLESDPKASSLPLVGVWLSGITHVFNPQVWAWCLRFLFSSSLQDRVLSESGCFLVVLFCVTKREAQFYQCYQPSKDRGQPEMKYQLLTASQTVTLYQHVEVVDGRSLQCELSPEDHSKQAEIFTEAQRSSISTPPPAIGLSISDQDSGVEDEDLSPRPSPNPHPLAQQARRVQPSVPELSLLMDGSFVSSNRIGLQDPCSFHKPPPPAHPRLLEPAPSHLLPTTHTPSFSPSANKKCPLPFGSAIKYGHPGFSSSSSSSSAPRSVPLHPKHLHSTPNSNLDQPSILLLLPLATLLLFQLATLLLFHLAILLLLTLATLLLFQLATMLLFHLATLLLFHLATLLLLPRATLLLLPIATLLLFHLATLLLLPIATLLLFHLATLLLFCQATLILFPQATLLLFPQATLLLFPQATLLLFPQATLLLASGTVTPLLSQMTVPFSLTKCPTTTTQHLIHPVTLHCCQQRAMGVLPPDAYLVLINQDRQLRMLQAQIQMLLEAQAKPSPTSQQADRSTATVAVGTGASLFWGPPVQPPSPQDLQDCPPSSSSPPSFFRPPTSSSTSSCGSVPPPLRPVGRAEDDDTKGQKVPCSPSDQLSSGEQVVAMFAEDKYGSEDESTETLLQISFRSCSLQSPVLGESASMYYHPDSSTTPQDQQRFYQDLLGQVTSRLQASGSQEEELGAEESRRKLSVSPPGAQPSSSRRREQSSREDPVVSATLSQLQQLGVSVDGDLSQLDRVRLNTVESASTLACINPAAVVPRLSLAEPAGSSLFPGGSVDLSLEANAIALRYLTDSQLCRLSLGSHATRPSPSSPENSHLSPSNMSLATKRYMRRYGLIEEESSEEEVQSVYVNEPGEQEAQTRQPLSEGLNVPQSQLTWNLRPKMQFLAGVAKARGANKENCAARRPSLGAESNHQPEGSMGNFLDLSRLRQLPKLF